MTKRLLFCGLFALGVLAACSSSPAGEVLAGSGCSALEACCAQISVADQGTCEAVVGEGSDSACTQALTAYSSAGACVVLYRHLDKRPREAWRTLQQLPRKCGALLYDAAMSMRKCRYPKSILGMEELNYAAYH